MDSQKSCAVLLGLLEELKKKGSWCGETHIQKAIFSLQELFDTELGFEFLLYKHGPFSFDLRDKLTELRADGLIGLEMQPYPYGPSLVLTDEGYKFLSQFPKTLQKVKEPLEFVGRNLGSKKVEELERLATALYVTKTEPEFAKNVEACAKRIMELKPHIPRTDALRAKEIVDEMLSQV